MRVEAATLLKLVILQWAVAAAMHSQEDAMCVSLKAMGEGSRATVCAELRNVEAVAGTWRPKQCSVLCGREDLLHISASDSARESAGALPANWSHFADGPWLGFSDGTLKRSLKEVLPMQELEKKMEVELVARRRLQASGVTATCFNFLEFPFMVPSVRQHQCVRRMFVNYYCKIFCRRCLLSPQPLLSSMTILMLVGTCSFLAQGFVV